MKRLLSTRRIKGLAAALALILTASLIAACTPGGETDGTTTATTTTAAGGVTDETDEPGGTTEAPDETEDTDAPGETDETDAPDGTDPVDTEDPGGETTAPGEDQVNNGEPVEISYINWNLGTEEDNNLERRMIAEYMVRYPNVTVRLADYIDTTQYGESLTNAAAGGRLPDVFMLSTIPFGLNGDWLLDLSSLTADDSEWASIANPVLDAVSYGEAQYAVPAGQFIAGMWLNPDVFAAANVPQPQFGYTMDELDEAIEALTNPANQTLGIEYEVDMVNWYPFVQDPSMGWFTWDGEKYNLDSQLFTEAVNKARSYFENGSVFDALSDTEKEGYEGANSFEVWMAGRTAFKYDGSWMAGGFADMSFTPEFIGLPEGRVVIIGDYIGINKDTENAEAAYHFARWMTFSTQGQLERISIVEQEESLNWGSMPITNDPAVLEAYFATNRVAGFEEAYENIDDGLVEAVKIVPGFVRSRWEAETGIAVGDNDNATIGDLIFDAIRGNTQIEDYIDQINDLANSEYQSARDAIEADLGG